MITSLAQVISFLSNPIILLLFVPLFLVYRSSGNISLALFWTGYTIVYLLLITAFLLYGVRKKIFTDMDVSTRTQRPLLFGVTLIMVLLYLVGVVLLHGPALLVLLAAGVLVSIILVSIINTKLKISIHVATVATALFTCALVYRGISLLVLLLIPLVAWSRVRINRHTLPETVAGACFGVLLSIVLYSIAKQFIS